MRSCCWRPNFQSGLATCIRRWGGFKKTSKALQVWASSPQQFTEDTGVSSPTFLTGRRDYDQICRLCSLRTQGWCTEVRLQSPAAVRFRTSRPAAAQNSPQQFSWAVNFGSVLFLDWVCDVIPSALRDGSMVTRPVVRTRSSHPVSFFRRPLVYLLLRALGTTVSGMVVQPGPSRVPGLFILQAGGMMVYLEVDCKFCFSLQVVFLCSLQRVLRSMCAAGRRSHTFSRDFHFLLFTLARVLLAPWKLWFSCVSCTKLLSRYFSYALLNRYTHRRAGRELGGGYFLSSFFFENCVRYRYGCLRRSGVSSVRRLQRRDGYLQAS